MTEDAKWSQIAWEFFHDPGRMGGFYWTLCVSIQMADMENTTRLRKGFPELVAYVKGEKHVWVA